MILVTGATGNVGRNVVEQLLGAGESVRALTRNPERAGLPDGAEVVRGDLHDPASLPAALDGVDAVFLFAVPGSASSFIAAAKEAGVRRVVFLSSGAVDDSVEEQANPIAAFHADIERELAASGLEWTFVRPSSFAVNALEWTGQLSAGDAVRGAYAEATMAPVHEEDIAAVSVAALTGEGHAGAVHEVTGPQSLTNAEQVELLGKVLDRPVYYEELPPAVVRDGMQTQGVPQPIVDALFDVWSSSVGTSARVTDTVERITGRPARSFAQWAADHAADFR
jgi:uncharacterized protein YbjT (DUF2867 family)